MVYSTSTKETRVKIYGVVLSTATCRQIYEEACPLFFTHRQFSFFYRSAQKSVFHHWVNRQRHFTARQLSAIRNIRLWSDDVLDESFERDIGKLHGLRDLTVMFLSQQHLEKVRAKSHQVLGKGVSLRFENY